MRELRQLRAAIEQRKGQRDRVVKELTQALVARDALIVLQDRIEEARALIQVVAVETQSMLEYRLGELVSLALNAVFGPGWSFRVLFEVRRGRTEADLLFEDAEGHRIDPISADGGGAVDVAALALRISLWSLRQPRRRNVIVLDEPFLHLSKDKWDKMIEVLRELSGRLGVQFIIVSHEESMADAADRVFHVSQKDGKSTVKREDK